jgi:hypothetical protein
VELRRFRAWGPCADGQEDFHLTKGASVLRQTGAFKSRHGVGRVLAIAACLAVVPVPAFADEFDPTGTGSLGAADLTVDGQTSHSGPLAPCAVGSRPANSTGQIVVGPGTRFGPGSTSCRLNPDHTASVAVDGQNFDLRLLSRYGGPVIRISRFTAACDTTPDYGIRTRMGFTGVSGVAVPSTIPANYTVTIPGAAGDSRPMAVVVLNEVVSPPPDGVLAVNAMHIKVFPQGGPAGGDVVVGSVRCAP